MGILILKGFFPDELWAAKGLATRGWRTGPPAFANSHPRSQSFCLRLRWHQRGETPLAMLSRPTSGSGPASLPTGKAGGSQCIEEASLPYRRVSQAAPHHMHPNPRNAPLHPYRHRQTPLDIHTPTHTSFFFFYLFRASPTAYGSSQARG